MLPDTEKSLINAYVDREMNLESQLGFEERLAVDPELRAQVESLKLLSASVREEARYHRAPADLRARFARPSAGVGERRPGKLVDALSRWFPWNPALPAAALVVVVAVAINISLLRMGEADRVRQELVASHVRATLTQRAIDVASSDQHTVKPWLGSQLDFSPPVHELALPGAALLGGRVDFVQGRRVAVLVYQYRKHMVDHYIWPTGEGDSLVGVTVVNGFKVAQWTRGGMAHRLVSDLNEQELHLVVQACRQADKG